MFFRPGSTLPRRAAFALLFVLAAAAATRHGFAEPPPELVQLEREVSLRIAHERDAILTAAELKQLQEAERVDIEGENALKAGDYEAAERAFLRAKLLVRELGR